MNQPWIDYTGLSLEESQGWAWTTAGVIHPDDLPTLLDTWRGVLAAGQPDEAEARLRRVDGEYRWFLIRAVPLRDPQGAIVTWCGTNTEIEEIKRAESLLAGQNRLLEMLAQRPSSGLNPGRIVSNGGERIQWFFRVDYAVESERQQAVVCRMGQSPVGLHGRTQRSGYRPAEGSCGTAVYRNEPVIVSDIAADPLWSAYKDVALAHGVRACWSTPIRSSGGTVLGTFAILSREPGKPTRHAPSHHRAGHSSGERCDRAHPGRTGCKAK